VEIGRGKRMKERGGGKEGGREKREGERKEVEGGSTR
jgi:hypothetical protein